MRSLFGSLLIVLAFPMLLIAADKSALFELDECLT